MPSKYIYKNFSEDSYYHVYNRGVEKREIFLDDQDYNTFIYLLKRYLDPDFTETKITIAGKKVEVYPNSCSSGVSLVSFCLMPNHFHLLVKLKKADGMTDLLRKVCTNYTAYFNTKYERVGKLYQGIYKAVLIETEEKFLHLSRYIHLNPLAFLKTNSELHNYKYSSYYYVISNEVVPWLQWKDILGAGTQESYIDFVEAYNAEKEQKKRSNDISDLLLE